MTFSYPDLIVQVATGKTPFDIVTLGDWVSMPATVERFTMKRGRPDQFTRFGMEPSTIRVDFDINDDLSLAAGFEAFSQPLTPVRVLLDHKGTKYPLWRGYLGPEPWQPTLSPNGRMMSVSIEAFDRMAMLAQVAAPESVWAIFPLYWPADWWLTGDVGFPLLGDGEEIPNASKVGGAATIVAPGSKVVSFSGASLVSGVDNPSMAVDDTVQVFSPEALVMPDGDVDDVTFGCWWQGLVSPGGIDQVVARQQVGLSGGDLRWRVVCVPDGTMRLDLYDAVGTPTVAVTVSAPGGGRWDDGQPHFIYVRHVGGASSELWVDGEDAVETGSPLDKVRAADLILGDDGTDQVQVFDEVVFLHRALTDTQQTALLFFVNGNVAPWAGDTFEDRIEHWYLVSGFGFGNSDRDQWHNGAGTAATYWGVGGVYTDLAATLVTTAGFERGEVWCTRAGFIRCRTMDALTNPAYADDYATPAIHLTDEASPAGTPTPGRRAQPEFSGIRLDRVVNEVVARFRYEDPVTFVESQHVIRFRDQPSIDLYGRRSFEFPTDVRDWETVGRFGYAELLAHSQPPVEINAAQITPVGSGDESVMDWLVDGCELERAVKVTATDPLGNKYVDTLNVQGEAWDWDQTRSGAPLVVTLNLAKS